jgi:hypothetical protein
MSETVPCKEEATAVTSEGVVNRQLRWPIACLIALLAALAGAAEPIDDEERTTFRQLTWEDFRRTVPRGQKATGVNTNVVVEMRRAETEEASPGRWVSRPLEPPSVYAVMNKRLSGVEPKGRTEEALSHEQIHFDITEIFARRLYVELQSAEAEGATRLDARNALMQVVRRTHQSKMDEREEMQARYDDESRDGGRRKQQQEWAEEVAAMLAAEEPYPLP